MDTGGRKNNHKKKEDSVLGSGLATVDEIMNDAIPLVNGAAAKEDVYPSMADRIGTPTIGNTPGKSSYANITGTPLMLALLHLICVSNLGIGSGHYTCNVRGRANEWKPHSGSSGKICRSIHEDCPQRIRCGEKKDYEEEASQKTFGGVLKGVEPTIEVGIQLHLMSSIAVILIWSLVPLRGY
ncbi:hypothetical protein Tco_0010041 [Tanacetum coccineum]